MFMVLSNSMGMLRNIRHEHFCRELIRTGNGAEAYRRVSAMFPTRRPLNHRKSAGVLATNLRKRPDVRRREMELRQIMAKKSDITMDKVLTDLEAAIQMAKAQAKPNDLVNASLAQAKVVGMLRERIEQGAAGDFDDMENISDILAKLEELVGAEAALAVATAFGYTKVEPNDKKEANSLLEQVPPSDSVN